ncbi:MAG: 3',5'-cyclic AMP phosphodiesterase CpdA [Kiritimatiellia bacterium]|jgi:3',5'-cyclic AMP phosphodiesterase CpdA
MRIAHATDIHWFLRPSLSRLLGKRLLGTANLYLRGRRHHFTRQVQDALVAHIVELNPDLVIVTGDLTAQALPEEFSLAKEQLNPVLKRFPTVLMPGNHDAYTGGSIRDKRMLHYFKRWMYLQDGPVGRLDEGAVTVLTLDPTRAHFSASGLIPLDQLNALRTLLSSDELTTQTVILALHYPLLSRSGQVYDGADHGLRNASDLIALLDSCPVKPAAILHGHRHHGYRVDLPLSGVNVPIFNPGAGGYAWLPSHDRTGAMNLYTTAPNGDIAVERYLFDGQRFSPEEGGSYATGR